MNQPQPEIRPGTLIENKYQVNGVLGKGGMGTVYEATQVSIGRKVAVKCLHSMYTDNPQLLYRFRREAQAAAAIGHDNICEVTDLGEGPDGAPYFVMPLLRGQTLAELLRNVKTLPLEKIIDICCQVLAALEAAHAVGIVHRDLKPGNIFICKVGDRENFVKLLDFGVSKVLSDDAPSDLTRTGVVMGTSNYMSPEQARGSKTIDRRADIFAMGVILYECCTHKRPFDGDSYNEVIYKILFEDYAPPSNVDASIPGALEAVILTAMAKDPEHRYGTAARMYQAMYESAADFLPSNSLSPLLPDPASLAKQSSLASLIDNHPRPTPASEQNAPRVDPSSIPMEQLAAIPTVNTPPPTRPSSRPPRDKRHNPSPITPATPPSNPASQPGRTSNSIVPGVVGIALKSTRYQHETWIVYQGKEILIRDYSNLNSKDATHAVAASVESTAELIKKGKKDLLILSDVTGSFANRETVNEFKKLGSRLRPYTKKLAVVGIAGIQKLLLKAISTFTGIPIHQFDTRKEAIEWLVAE